MLGVEIAGSPEYGGQNCAKESGRTGSFKNISPFHKALKSSRTEMATFRRESSSSERENLLRNVATKEGMSDNKEELMEANLCSNVRAIGGNINYANDVRTESSEGFEHPVLKQIKSPPIGHLCSTSPQTASVNKLTNESAKCERIKSEIFATSETTGHDNAARANLLSHVPSAVAPATFNPACLDRESSGRKMVEAMKSEENHCDISVTPSDKQLTLLSLFINSEDQLIRNCTCQQNDPASLTKACMFKTFPHETSTNLGPMWERNRDINYSGASNAVSDMQNISVTEFQPKLQTVEENGSNLPPDDMKDIDYTFVPRPYFDFCSSSQILACRNARCPIRPQPTVASKFTTNCDCSDLRLQHQGKQVVTSAKTSTLTNERSDSCTGAFSNTGDINGFDNITNTAATAATVSAGTEIPNLCCNCSHRPKNASVVNNPCQHTIPNLSNLLTPAQCRDHLFPVAHSLTRFITPSSVRNCHCLLQREHDIPVFGQTGSLEVPHSVPKDNNIPTGGPRVKSRRTKPSESSIIEEPFIAQDPGPNLRRDFLTSLLLGNRMLRRCVSDPNIVETFADCKSESVITEEQVYNQPSLITLLNSAECPTSACSAANQRMISTNATPTFNQHFDFNQNSRYPFRHSGSVVNIPHRSQSRKFSNEYKSLRKLGKSHSTNIEPQGLGFHPETRSLHIDLHPQDIVINDTFPAVAGQET